MRLYDNPFSPFARKVRMVLHHKGLPFESVDALAHAHLDELAAVNPRVEVPVLHDGDLTVVNSSDIVSYLDHRYPQPPVYPADPGVRARARAWERLADTQLDAIIHNISIWMWPTLHREDSAPAGLIETGAEELRDLYAQLEAALGDTGFVCGDVSVADFAFFPHLSGVRLLGVPFTAEEHPKLLAWYKRMRQLDACRRDLDYVAQCAQDLVGATERRYEDVRIKWRGDRLEWMLSRGFHEWWYGELEAGRVAWPVRGLAV